MVNKGHLLPYSRKRFGQHFLRDRLTIRKIIESMRFENSGLVVEIGPGRGALTTPLVECCSQLHLIEIDRDLVNILSEKYADNAAVTVHQGDALQFDYSRLVEPSRSKLMIVGNLPYNISTPLLIRLLSCSEVIREMVFMVQREIAERLTANPGYRNYGRLTVNVGRSFLVKTLFEVGPEVFSPAPKVHSSVIRLSPRVKPLGPVVDTVLFANVVRDAFSQRRKTLRNSLKHYEAEAILIRLGIDPQLRAERLSIEQFAELVSELGR